MPVVFTVTVTVSPSLIEVVDNEFVNVANEESVTVILLEDATTVPVTLSVLISIENVSEPSPTVKSDDNVFVKVAESLLTVRDPVNVLSVKSAASTLPFVV